jgi:hypothetical protein
MAVIAPGFKFTPTKDFECKENRSIYLKGLSYQVRPGNEQLAKLVGAWLAQGLVVEAIVFPATSRVRGKGKVSG